MNCGTCRRPVSGPAQVTDRGVFHTGQCWTTEQNRLKKCPACQDTGQVDDSSPGGTYLPCHLCADCPKCGGPRKDGKFSVEKAMVKIVGSDKSDKSKYRDKDDGWDKDCG